MFIRKHKLGRLPSKSDRAIMEKITGERIKIDIKRLRSSAIWHLSLFNRFPTFRRKVMPSYSGSRLSDDATSCTRRTESSSTSLPKRRDWQIEETLTEGPWRSSQSHGTARPSRDGLWATCPLSASSSYHAEFHEDCYQKLTILLKTIHTYDCK